MAVGEIAPLLGIADEALTAADLIRRQRLWALPATMRAGEAFVELTTRGYTVAPLVDVPITRFVRREDVTAGGSRRVDEFALEVASAATIPETAALSDVLLVLRRHPFVFVRHRQHVTGVVTRADLEQPIIGLLVLGTILSIEAAIDVLLQRRDDDDWLRHLSEERARRVQEVFEQRRAADADLHATRCLNLDDRLTLARKLDLAATLGFVSKQQLKDWDRQVGRIRDHLAHGDTLLSAVPDPVAALDAVLQLRDTAQTAWRAASDEE